MIPGIAKSFLSLERSCGGRRLTLKNIAEVTPRLGRNFGSYDFVERKKDIVLT